MSVLPDVATTSGNVMMYNTEGEKVWTKDLPHLAPGVPYLILLNLSTMPSGLIIMCNVNTHKVSVVDSSGQQHEFPTEFIKKSQLVYVLIPRVMCWCMMTLMVQYLSSVLTGHLLRSFSHTMYGSVD